MLNSPTNTRSSSSRRTSQSSADSTPLPLRTNPHHPAYAYAHALDGTWEFDECDEFDQTFCKEVPGIREEELYQPRPPTVDEVYKFVKIAAGFSSNAQVVEMFVAKRMNGYPDPLIDFVLSR